MALTNAYATLDELRAVRSIEDTLDDERLETALNAASREIDAYCGRFFYQDSVVASRQYFADDYQNVCVDDISTTTGLIVKIDSADDGSFATTLTITTDFILLPLNAADNVPVQPYTEIRSVGGYAFPRSASGRPGVQVTAKFGWPAVPDDVTKACLIQATQLSKAEQAPFGGVQLGVDGAFMRVRETMNPIASALLEPYVKGRVG